MTGREKWLGSAFVLLVLLALSGWLWSRRTHPIENYVRHSLARIAQERAGADLQIASLKVETLPHFRIWGSGLVVTKRGNTSHPPLISIRYFSVKAGLLALFFRHFQELKLDGIEINVPPKKEKGEGAGSTGAEPASGTAKRTKHRSPLAFSISEIVATHTTLRMLHPDNSPSLTFAIHQVRMTNFQPDSPVEYFATLTNAKPSGEIQTHGFFGPWNKDEPGETHVRGTYLFSHANLGELKGISGILSSQGSFRGALDYLDVQGRTQTPDFALDIAHHEIPLNTEFTAIVNGTNGNTILDPLRLQLGKSSLIATGEIAKLDKNSGRRILLNVKTEDASLEDLLQLAVKSKSPVLSGKLELTTSFILPSRKKDHRSVTDRLQMSGTFHARRAKFRKDIQKKINSLSQRGKGSPGDPPPVTALSNFAGRFRIANGAIRFSRLAFDVPGAKVSLAGKYNLDRETLDFQGTLSLDAKLSQTTTGWKSLLLKAIDPLFEKKNAGAVLPIHISGTREKPSFKLDLSRIFARDGGQRSDVSGEPFTRPARMRTTALPACRIALRRPGTGMVSSEPLAAALFQKRRPGASAGLQPIRTSGTAVRSCCDSSAFWGSP